MGAGGEVRLHTSAGAFSGDRYVVACLKCGVETVRCPTQAQAEALFRDHVCPQVQAVDPRTVLHGCAAHGGEFTKGCVDCWAADMFGTGRVDVDGR